MVTVVGPKRVIYLNSVAKEIKSLNADGMLPDKNRRWFFFPHLKRKGAVHQNSQACTLPALLSPLIVLGYEHPEEAEDPQGENAATWRRKGFYAFYDGAGQSEDEFKYLIDYFFMYQQEHGQTHICINLLFPDENAAAIFEKAKQQFARDYWPVSGKDNIPSFDKLMNNITFRQIQSVIQKFSGTVLGMTRA